MINTKFWLLFFFIRSSGSVRLWMLLIDILCIINNILTFDADCLDEAIYISRVNVHALELFSLYNDLLIVWNTSHNLERQVLLLSAFLWPWCIFFCTRVGKIVRFPRKGYSYVLYPADVTEFDRYIPWGGPGLTGYKFVLRNLESRT